MTDDKNEDPRVAIIRKLGNDVTSAPTAGHRHRTNHARVTVGHRLGGQPMSDTRTRIANAILNGVYDHLTRSAALAAADAVIAELKKDTYRDSCEHCGNFWFDHD